jgi:glycosyltransferase involved in cell wall biosynthesis
MIVNMSTISVVIPTYDRNNLVIRAINSVLEQSHTPDEILIIDDCSPTPVEETIKNSNTDHNRITVCRHNENKGGNAARKTGMKLATGDFLAFLDDDDEWEQSKLQQQLQTVKKTDLGVIYTGVKQINQGQVVAKKTPNKGGNITTELLRGNFIGTFSSILLRQDLIETVGYPDPDLPSWQDWDYYLRLSTETEFAAVPKPMLRRHTEGHTQVSQDHTIKRDVTAPTFFQKHRSLADKYNLRTEFEATIAAELGWSAALNGDYNEARRQYLKSLRLNPSKEALLFFCLTLGGRLSFKSAQKLKRKLVVMNN